MNGNLKRKEIKTMAHKKWCPTRQCDATKPKIRFEKLLAYNGYTVLGYKEYASFTDFLIEKDNFKCDYKIHNADNKKTVALKSK